jgi:hypothetical protein
MSIADHPVPRVPICRASPGYAQSRLDCPDQMKRASERDHTEEGD